VFLKGPLQVFVLMLWLIAGDLAESGLYPTNRTYDLQMDTGSALKGPLGAMLSDISLRLQQHDHEQRLDSIQHLQQRELQQQLSVKQAELQRELLEHIRQMQVNMSVEMERIGKQQTAMYRNVTEELNGRKLFGKNFFRVT
jgi:hypothetical protein